MQHARYTSEELDALRRISSPTIANAIECFRVRPQNEGFMNHRMQCRFPELGVLVGYAVTVRFAADQPASQARPPVPDLEYYEYVASQPGPKVLVAQDLDLEPVGSLWGEVNTNIHQALGCLGTVTQGGVRDLVEMERLGFHTFSTCLLVSHAFVHYVDYGGPVRAGGLTVRPGDLIHADRHGVIAIPAEIPIAALVEVADQIEALEQEIFAYCQGDTFTPQGLAELRASVKERWPRRPVAKER